MAEKGEGGAPINVALIWGKGGFKGDLHMSEKVHWSPINTDTLIGNNRRWCGYAVNSVILGERDVIVMIDGSSTQIPHVIDYNWLHGSPAPIHSQEPPGLAPVVSR